MRKIKFRAKTKYDSNYYSAGQWVEGHYHMKMNGRHYITVHEDYDGDIRKPCKSEHIEIDETTLGQFTGLYDKDNKEIFEGDLVFVTNGHTDQMNRLCEIQFSDGKFIIKHPAYSYSLAREKRKYVEVVGNKYDHY